jgi:hypothetical protein
MSIKKEVEQLTNVYSKLLNEQMDPNGVNIGVGADMGGMPMGQDDISGFDDTTMATPIGQENGEDIMHAHVPSADTNASMARSEVFKIAKYADELMSMLKCSETDVEPWQLSKITKAADYMCSVKNAIEYDEFEKMSGEMNAGLSEMGAPSPVVVKVRDMLASEPLEVNEEVLKQAIFNIECIKEASKAKEPKKHDSCKSAKKGCKCDKCAQCRANKKKK